MIRVFNRISDRPEDWENLSVIREQFSILSQEVEDCHNLMLSLHDNQVKMVSYVRNLENKISALGTEIKRERRTD